jgi:hypothetical protein
MNDGIASTVVRHSSIGVHPSLHTRFPTPSSIPANMKLTTTVLVASLGLLAAATPTPVVGRRAVGDPMCGGT